MKTRRWPDVVIVVAIAAIGAFGAYALWGEELGLRKADKAETPARAPGPGGTTT